jgi:hypothetical protein
MAALQQRCHDLSESNIRLQEEVLRVRKDAADTLQELQARIVCVEAARASKSTEADDMSLRCAGLEAIIRYSRSCGGNDRA